VPRPILALLVVVLGAGCETLARNQAELARWQLLADQAMAHAGQPRVIVKPIGGMAGHYDCRENRVIFGTDNNPRWLLAHELGHYVMQHCDSQPWEVMLVREKAANEFAVTTLQVWGLTEEQAVRDTVLQLLVIKRLSRKVQYGHDYCAEVLDVLRRHPQVPDPRPAAGDLTCLSGPSR